MEEKNKYVYLIGSDSSKFIGYTFNKETALSISKYRRGCYYKKVKYTKKLNENLDKDFEFMGFGDDFEIYLNQIEYEYYCDAFATFIDNVTHYLPQFISNIKCIKLTDKEKEPCWHVINMLTEYYRLLNDPSPLDEDDIESILYKQDKIYKFFIRKIL